MPRQFKGRMRAQIVQLQRRLVQLQNRDARETAAAAAAGRPPVLFQTTVAIKGAVTALYNRTVAALQL